MFKPEGILVCGALLLLAGCTSLPRSGDGPVPQEWQMTNAVPAPLPSPNPLPANPPPKTVIPPVVSNVPPQISPRPAPILTWTSLDRWAAENKLAAPRRVANSPVANYAISSPMGTMILGIGSREATWRGLEINLGFAPEVIDDQIFVYGLDLQKNLEPLLLGEPPGFGGNRTIVIDPGHGGANPGTQSVLAGRLEKEFTLDWAKRLKALLETNGWVVFLTRTSDIYVTNANRVNFSEALHAGLFISLHFNSTSDRDKKTGGIETYCLTPSGMPSTLTRGYADPLSENLPNNQFDVQNLWLAVRVQSALVRATGLEDRGVRRARFETVLRGQNRPAILVEGGYLSNPQEAAKIESGGFREKLAQAVADALK